MDVQYLFKEWSRIRSDMGRIRLDFIRTDLRVCFTFASVADTAFSMGHWDHAKQTLANAEKGYTDMLRFFLQARGLTAVENDELVLIFNRLRERLDGLQAH